MSELNDKVFQLIEEKDYDKLSQEERELVLSCMTIQSYKQQRSALLSLQSQMQNERMQLQPDPEILRGLQQRLDKEQPAMVIVPMWKRVVQHKIPAYWVAIASICVLAFVAFWPKPDAVEKIQYVEKEVPVYSTVYDTVYLENEKPINREVIEKIIYVKQTNPSRQERINTVDLVESRPIVVPQVPDIEQIEESFGNQTISSDQLNQFRVSL